jgi:hypothetical protein
VQGNKSSVTIHSDEVSWSSGNIFRSFVVLLRYFAPLMLVCENLLRGDQAISTNRFQNLHVKVVEDDSDQRSSLFCKIAA